MLNEDIVDVEVIESEVEVVDTPSEVDAQDEANQADTVEVETSEEEGDESATSSEEDLDAEEEGRAEPKAKAGVQKRIDELTKAKYEAQREAAQNAHYKAQYEAMMQAQLAEQAQAQAQNSMPKAEEYTVEGQFYAEAYQKAVLDWSQGAAQQQAEMKEHTQANIQKEALIQAKVASAIDLYPDFQEKVQNPDLPKLADVNPTALEAIVDSDGMADIAYHYATNPAELHALASMNPLQSIKAVTKLELKLAAKASQPKPPVSPPVRIPAKVKSASSVKVDVNDMNTDEYLAYKRAQRVS